MEDNSAGQGPFGFNSWLDLFNGGGRQANGLAPPEGYRGVFDLGGLFGAGGGAFGGAPGAAGGRALGGRLEDYFRNQGWFGQGQGQPEQNPAAPPPERPPGRGTPFSDNLGNNTSGGGSRNVYVGDYGGAGNVSFANAPPMDQFFGNGGSSGLDDLANLFDPAARFANMNGTQGGPGGGGQGVPSTYQPNGLEGLFGPDFMGNVQQAPIPGLQGGGGGGGQGGGGGGQGGGGQAAGDAFLADQFNNGSPTFQIDPALQDMINGIVNDGASGFDQFSQLLGGENPLLQMLMGMLGGGGGGSFGGGQASGGGGGGAPNVGFRMLPPEMQALIDQQTSAATGQLNLQTADIQDSMLASLYGAGTERSSIANNEVGRVAYGQGELLNQILAAGAGRTTDLMSQDLQSQTALGQSQIAANASRFASSQQAGSQRYGAGLSALANMFGSQAGALASGFGAHTQGQGNFASILGDIGINQAGLDQGAYLGLLDSGTRLNESSDRLSGDRAAASASRFGSNLNYQGLLAQLQEQAAGRQQSGFFDMLNFGQGQYEFGQDFGLRERGVGLAEQEFERSGVSGSDRLYTLLGQLLGAYGNSRGNDNGGG